MATAFLPSAPIRLSPALHGTVPRLKRRQASPQKLLFDPSSWFPSHGLQGRRSDMRYGYRRASSELRAGEGGTERARARDLENADKDKEQQSDAKKPSGKPRKRRRAWKARGEVPDQDLEGFVSERRSLPGKLKKGKENPPRLSSGMDTVNIPRVQSPASVAVLRVPDKHASDLRGLTSLLHVHQMLMTNRKQTSAQSTPFLASPPWTPGPTPETAERQSAAASLPRTGPVRSEPGAISGLFKTETDRARLANLAAPGGISPALVSAVQEARVRAIGSSEPGYRPLPLGPAQIPVPDGGWGHLHVVGGRFGGRRLMMPRGGGVRPMMAKVKEALFSMLQRMGVLGCVGEQRLRVLDLFSGSGALSVEAFSRGAEFALLADSSLDSCEAAAVNVQYCGVADRSYIVRASVEELLLVPERYLRLPSRLVEQTRHLRTIRKLCEEGKKLALASTEGRPVLQDALRALSTPESSSDVDRQGEEGSTEAPMALQHELRTLPDVGSSASQRLFESVVNEAANSERELGRKHTYGLVFLCPPYTKVVYKELIQLLLDCSIVGNDAVVVVEYPKEIGCLPYLIRSDASSAALVGLRNRAYGRTCIAVYCKQKLFSVADLARIQRTCPASMQEALVTDGNSGVSAHVEEQRPAEASQSDLHVTHVETETRVPTMPRSSEMHACRETVKGLLPISSLWYGQQRPEEFVPLGMRRQQLVAEGWIKGKKAAGRKNRAASNGDRKKTESRESQLD
ncbi:conserved hypothetical protein [Neospora caninum Liverpool]|uniref:Methyltransferase n=1 Tax=Neospora caninum (strain Liverpool) TaxID=572307 RepID=F0VJ13_NEOCL|nr:conserved hypothetical protein [Neospora caninum Liverpool]CBZ53724.1 conserved hypothetical protein [Neospora caninum Liverpool]CEL67714.1 TPA: hypothetical protein BN1204_035060 [Neospora caninum Liverpool]|eukprot:XP_003883756.1 conserved hypothetical protein [Neospora caninum Liverpool]